MVFLTSLDCSEQTQTWCCANNSSILSIMFSNRGISRTWNYREERGEFKEIAVCGLGRTLNIRVSTQKGKSDKGCLEYYGNYLLNALNSRNFPFNRWCKTILLYLEVILMMPRTGRNAGKVPMKLQRNTVLFLYLSVRFGLSTEFSTIVNKQYLLLFYYSFGLKEEIMDGQRILGIISFWILSLEASWGVSCGF